VIRSGRSGGDCANRVDTLEAAGCDLIFTEKVTGKSTNGCTEFERLMPALKPGIVVVTDRPAQVRP